jgi:hypothetical protein
MRTKRIAFCDGMFLMGFYIGNMLGGPVKENLGFGYNFALGMICSLLAVAWCIFYVKDSKELRDARLRKELQLDEFNDNDLPMSEIRRRSSIKAIKELQQAEKESKKGIRDRCYGLLRISGITEGFSAVFKKREGNKRICILLTLVAMTLDTFAGRGKWQSLFLYFRKVLNWTISQYSSFMSSLGLIGAISNYVLVPFMSRKLCFHDSTISIVDTTTSIIRLEIDISSNEGFT